MRRVALKGLAQRKLRTTLTALAVVLGVAMVSGTYVLTDTISHAFTSIFATSYQSTSAVIIGREVVKESGSGSATVPASIVDRVGALPGVQEASGAIFDVNSNADTAKILDRGGKAISVGGAPNFAFGFDPRRTRFNPLRLVEGRWAAGPGEMVIDRGTASKNHFAVGGSVSVAPRQGARRRFSIVGIARFGSVDSLGGATIAVFDVPTAQGLLHKRGQFDLISVAAAPGTAPAQLVDRIRPVLPGSATVRTGEQQASANSKDVTNATSIIQDFLLAFGGIALFVGAFVIFNTLSITVAQRAREFATLRTLGASRRQVLASVLVEGFAIGLLASVTGLFLGLGLAKALDALFNALGISLPRSGTVFATRTVVVSLVVGILVTVVASIAPARRATRVPPIAAAREGPVPAPSGSSRRRHLASALILAVALAALLIGAFGALDTGSALLAVGAGCLVLFIGVARVAGSLVRPLAAAVGQPARRLGGPAGRLAEDNATRNPRRTASAAAALMIGLALVTLVASLGAALRNTDRELLESTVTADYVVTSENGFDPFPAQAGAALARVPGVSVAANVRDDGARAFGADVKVEGVDPTIAETFRYRWSAGSDAVLRSLGAGGAVVQREYADKHHLVVGSPLQLTTPAGRALTLRVRAIDDPPAGAKIDPLFGKVSISRAAFDKAFPRPQNLFTFVKTPGGEAPATTAALTRALAPFPDARLHTKAAWVDKRSGGINTLLNLLYVLLALSVLVSLFGMVNTLALSVFERTRELGMLRAVGMTRRQVRRMIRHESVITSLIGAALGLPLGLLLAALVSRALADSGVGFAVPWGQLVVLTLVAVLAGLVAAILPARRAARLNVLEALQYE